jgi:hypothetical protein
MFVEPHDEGFARRPHRKRRSSILDGGNCVWSAPPSLRVSKQTTLTILMKSEATFESGLSYLLASDFDQTLSFNDSGYVLCDLLMFFEM